MLRASLKATGIIRETNYTSCPNEVTSGICTPRLKEKQPEDQRADLHVIMYFRTGSLTVRGKMQRTNMKRVKTIPNSGAGLNVRLLNKSWRPSPLGN